MVTNGPWWANTFMGQPGYNWIGRKEGLLFFVVQYSKKQGPIFLDYKNNNSVGTDFEMWPCLQSHLSVPLIGDPLDLNLLPPHASWWWW